jgi:hypothetical protein
MSIELLERAAALGLLADDLTIVGDARIVLWARLTKRFRYR